MIEDTTVLQISGIEGRLARARFDFQTCVQKEKRGEVEREGAETEAEKLCVVYALPD